MGAHGGQSLIHQPYWHWRTGVSQELSVVPRGSCGCALRTRQTPRQADDDLQRLFVAQQRAQPRDAVRALARVDGDHGGGEDPVRVRLGDSHPHTPHVDGEAHAAAQAYGFTHATATPIRSRAAVNAAPTALGSVPPPWAISSLPPPPPPSAVAAARTSSPARTPASRAASLVTATTTGRSLATAAMTTAAASAPRRERRSSANRRASSAPTPVPASCRTTRTSPTRSAAATVVSAEASSGAWRSDANSFSCDFSRAISVEIRSGSSSGREPRSWVTWLMMTCCWAWWR